MWVRIQRLISSPFHRGKPKESLTPGRKSAKGAKWGGAWGGASVPDAPWERMSLAGRDGADAGEEPVETQRQSLNMLWVSRLERNSGWGKVEEFRHSKHCPMDIDADDDPFMREQG